jgi:hypothetical protein
MVSQGLNPSCGLALVRIEVETAYLCKESLYDTAIRHLMPALRSAFPLRDVDMKEAAN